MDIICTSYRTQLDLSPSSFRRARVWLIGKRAALSGDDMFSTLKASWSFFNSDLGHLWHSSNSDHLPVLETLWSTSYSKPFQQSPTLLCTTSTPTPHPSPPPKVAPRPPPPKVAWRPLCIIGNGWWHHCDGQFWDKVCKLMCMGAGGGWLV